MKKYSYIIAFIIAICIFASPALAESIHVEHQISDLVKIDADFIAPEVDKAAVIRLKKVNLIDEAFTEKMAGILFHLDGDVSPTYFHKGSTLVTHNGTVFEDGEEIYVTDTGAFHYRDIELTRRYGEVVGYVENGFMFLWAFDENLIYTEDDLMDDHEGFARDDALKTAEKALQAIYEDFGAFEPRLVSQYAFTPQDCAAITEVIAKDADRQQHYNGTEEIPGVGYNPLTIDDWNRDDALYVFDFALALNGIPVLTKNNVATLTEEESFPQPTSEVYMNRGSGIYELNTFAYRMASEEELQDILAPDDIVKAISAYFDSIISMEKLMFTEAALEYLPISSMSDKKTIECIPVWRVTADLIVGETTYSDYRSYCFNAITGELVR